MACGIPNICYNVFRGFEAKSRYIHGGCKANMKIGILSDTHDNGRYILKAVDLFVRGKVALVLHCGDWDMPFTLQYFTDLKCPLKGVLGNGDPDINKFLWIKQELRLKLDLALDAHMLDLTLDDHRIAVVHGHSQPVVDLIIGSGFYDVLLTGHDHRPRIDKVDRTLLVNPGSLVGVLLPQHREFPYTVAMYDTNTRTSQIIELD